MSDNRLPDDWVVVAEAGHGAEASMIEGRLREAGIEVAVLEFRGAPGAWLTGAQPYWAPKSIAVPTADEPRAVEVIDSMSDLGAAGEGEEPSFDEAEDTTPVPAEGGPAAMSDLRRIAWFVAAVVVAAVLWIQCPGSA